MRKSQDSQFLTMSREDLAAWYERAVGYDPVEDDPTIELGELRENCRELALIQRCGGIDTKAYQRVEAQRKASGVAGGFYDSF